MTLGRQILSLGLTAAVSATATYYLVKQAGACSDAPVAKSEQCVGDDDYPEDLILEQLARNRVFLGDEGLQKIRNSSVAIIGLGGVGSWAATMLVRSGVGKIRLVDFDQVTLSSLNRHACATLADVGTTKVSCLSQYLHKVAPWVKIETFNMLWTKDCVDVLQGVDYVVDCIDNIDTKCDLLHYCHEQKIPVLSAMGAGAKADATRVQIADISHTTEDPLSRAVRIKLRARGVTHGIPCVFSTEKPGKAKLLELEEDKVQEGNIKDYSVLKDFRVRILPVLGPLPAIFGLTLATHILTMLGGYPGVYDSIEEGSSAAGKARKNLYDGAMRSLTAQFARLKWPEAINTAVTLKDVEYLLEEVWCGRTISGQCNKLCLTIWDPSKPRNISNIVPVSKEEQKAHEDQVLKNGASLSSVYSPEVMAKVSRRQDLDEWFQTMR